MSSWCQLSGGCLGFGRSGDGLGYGVGVGVAIDVGLETWAVLGSIPGLEGNGPAEDLGGGNDMASPVHFLPLLGFILVYHLSTSSQLLVDVQKASLHEAVLVDAL